MPDPLVVEYCDTWNTAYFDAATREYVLYTRNWSIGPRTDRLPPDIRNSWTGVGRRAIGRTSSKDFRRFNPSELILEPTLDMLPSEQIYTNCYTTIPGAPDQHLMFPTIWNGSIDDTTRIVLASSHDGKVWHWVPGGDLLRTPPFGRWDGGCVWATPNLLELPDGDWALPYIANNVPHKYPRGQRTSDTSYAVWPKGRMVAVEAEDHGEFTMITLVPPGKRLEINALTLRTGWVKVGVLGVDGHGLADCVPIVGDQHGTRVTWKGGDDLGVGEGKPITLRIEMKQAKLYGLEFEIVGPGPAGRQRRVWVGGRARGSRRLPDDRQTGPGERRHPAPGHPLQVGPQGRRGDLATVAGAPRGGEAQEHHGEKGPAATPNREPRKGLDSIVRNGRILPFRPASRRRATACHRRVSDSPTADPEWSDQAAQRMTGALAAAVGRLGPPALVHG